MHSNNNISKSYQLSLLVEAIKVVALDYEQQIKAFPSGAHVPDEIALSLEQALHMYKHSGDIALLDPEILEEIERLDGYFEDLPPEEFNLDSVRNSEKWQRPRLMAREILEKLGVENDMPSLDWVFYMPEKRESWYMSVRGFFRSLIKFIFW